MKDTFYDIHSLFGIPTQCVELVLTYVRGSLNEPQQEWLQTRQVRFEPIHTQSCLTHIILTSVREEKTNITL